MIRGAGLLACALLMCVAGFAQETRGKISGRVVDSSGAVVPGVEVRAVHVETKVSTANTTNAQGNFEIPYLPPGSYTLSAELAGFKKYVQTEVDLRVDDELSFEIKLEPGQVSESVTVTAETPLLETSTSLGQVVDNKRITELPLAGGNAYSLIQLTAGVVSFDVPNHPSLAPAVEVISNMGVNGMRDHNSEFSLDGAPSMWGRNASFAPPADMIGEFKVETARFDAAGRSPGGSINVALRSGTNQLHGTLSENHSDNKFGGIDFFQRQFLYDPSTGPVNDEKRKSVNPQFIFNHFGATLGGPAILPGLYDGRNRTFWMYGFDGLIRPSQARGDYTHTVPTASERQGDFSDLLRAGSSYQIYDPATTAPASAGRYSRQPFAANIVPQSRFNRVATGLLQYWPLPNVPGLPDGENNYWSVLSTFNEYYSHTTRVDHNFSEKNRFFARYNQSHQLFDNGKTLPNDANGTHRNRYGKGFGIDDVYVIGPELLVNFRYSLSRFIQTTTPLGKDFDLAAAGFSRTLIAQIDPRGLTFPKINLDLFETLGNGQPNGTFTNYHTWAADVTRVRGRHSLRIGGEFRLYRESNQDYSFQSPQIDFSTNWTRGPLDNSPASHNGQDLASFLLGLPTGGEARVNGSYAQQSMFTAGFVQDDFKLSRRLTLNLGLRYEYETAPTERYNRSVQAFDFSVVNPIQAQAQANYAASTAAQMPSASFPILGGLQFAGLNGNPRSLWGTDRNNFAPRAGIAVALAHRTVIRAGYGVFYVTNGVDRLGVNQAGFTQSTTLVASLDTGQTFVASLDNPFPNGYTQPRGAAGGLATNLGLPVVFFGATHPHSYAQRWSFGLQKQLPRSILAEASYVGTAGSRLDLTRQYDAVPRQYLSTLPARDAAAINYLTASLPNPFYPMLAGTDIGGKNVARSQLLKPYPEFNGITSVTQTGYSWYHSLQLRVERRFRNGFTVTGNYTWSKFMEGTSYLNATDSRPEYAVSDQDRPQRLVANGIYELPFGRGRKFGAQWHPVARFLASGWQISGVYQGQSGGPLAFGNVLLYDSPHNIVLPIGQRSVKQWFNTSKFERATGKQLANNIRAFPSALTGARLPGVNVWNASALRTFRIKERLKFQLRSEWLNALNHTFFAKPNVSATSAAFGTITSSTGYPRQIYFSAKLLF